jgi:hypothetical protein
MRNNNPEQSGHGLAAAEELKSQRAAAKWNALIEDTLVPSPQRDVRAHVLLAQAGVGAGKVLVRDHGGEEDVAMEHDELINLALGNVFYVVDACDALPKRKCTKPAKLALFVDDRPEVTLNPNQTGKTIRELFGLRDDVNLLRDYESPNDEPVGVTDKAPFERGPVFITRRQHSTLTIIVNSKPFTEADGVKKRMTGRQIATLVSDNPDATEVFKLGKGQKPDPVPLDKEIAIHDADEFRVIRKDVAGGFEPSRISRELKKLKDGGCRTKLIEQPFTAVIFRAVPTRPGYPHVKQTDVLVRVPSGYPGAFIDGAYLPQESPLLGRVAGQRGQGTIQADGRVWELVSYHPHNGGGGPMWNKDRHGFHTYFDEILYWIQHAKD